ncbi:MAG: bacillithiol biosynthesis cysteine-adding enzyme BshC [Balneolaceae bacterium]|nr:bacillithiol biosynthesis cysteine-adding enzyme BshC [Balneolaceae bacterium]
MNLDSYSFKELPFTKLFLDYIHQFENLTDFYETDPFSEDDIERRILEPQFSIDRERIVRILKKYNLRFEASDTVLASIEKLKDESSVAVVTGQQLTYFGGPLYTVFKILTAILTAKKWEEKYGIPTVPVFWMADEDHDYEEISSIGIPQRDHIEKVQLEYHGENEPRSGKIKLNQDFKEFKKKVIELQPDTDFTDPLWRKLDSSYKVGESVEKAFGKWVLSLFDEYGLILAGSADPDIKEYLKDVMIHSVENTEHHYDLLQEKTEALIEKGYHGQVHLNYSNLFRIDDELNRVKLTYSDNQWSEEVSGNQWSTHELMNEIEEHPERFSPNVFLRPVFQNKLLPCASYIAGPGEIAYYAQMKSFYSDFGITMPVILPRYSVTLVESGIDRILDKLPFSFPEYENRIEDLESEYIEKADTPDIEKIFGQWKQQINAINEEKTKAVKEIDPTLKGSSEKVTSHFHSELDKLKGKVYRAVKDQEKTQLKRIEKIKNNLFPLGNLQEREVAFIYFMNKYGLEIWDKLLLALEEEDLKTHKLVRM